MEQRQRDWAVIALLAAFLLWVSITVPLSLIDPDVAADLRQVATLLSVALGPSVAVWLDKRKC